MTQLSLPGTGDDQVVAERYGPPPVPASPLRTSGRTEYTAWCTRCRAHHRHTGPGLRRGPCGALYTIPASRTD